MNAIYVTKAEALAQKQELQRELNSGIKGTATVTSSPTPYVSGILFEKYNVYEAGTYTNFKDASLAPIVVSSGDLADNFVFIEVTNGVAKKVMNSKPTVTLKQTVDPLNTTEAVTGKAVADFGSKIITEFPNKFDKTKVTSGGYFTSVNPYGWVVAPTISESQFFDIKAGDTINFKLTNTSSRHIVYKNEAGLIYAGELTPVVGGQITKTIAEGSVAKQIAIQIFNSELDSVMVTINEVLPATYEPFQETKLNQNLKIDGVSIKVNSIGKDKVNFSTVEDVIKIESKNVNIFDKSKINIASYYKAGVLTTSEKAIDSYNVTDLKNGDIVRFKVTKNLTGLYHFALLNSVGSVIFSGTKTAVDGVISVTITADTQKTISMMLFHSDIDNVMVTVNNPIPTEYIPFGGKVTLKDNLKNDLEREYNLKVLPTKDDYLIGRNLIWEEDFKGGRLDENSWNIMQRKILPAGNLGTLTNRPTNIKVENSNLVLTAKKEKYRGADYTTAMVNSAGKKEFKFGRIEAKIKLAGGVGYWPAFWMLGQCSRVQPKDIMTMESYHNGGVPYCGEIDIMEFYGSSDKVESRLHAPMTSGTGVNSSGIITSQSIAIVDYNIYAIEWTENQIIFIVNGNTVATIDTSVYATNGRNAFNEPMYLILNFSLREENVTVDTPKEGSIYVDWVRVYTPSGNTYTEPTSFNIYKRDISVSGGVIYQGVTANETLIESNLNLNVGDKILLVGKNIPANTSFQTVDWRSSDESIFTCDGGIINALKVGVAKLTVVNDNYIVKNITVTVV